MKIRIDLAAQTLMLTEANGQVRRYAVSTARAGAGEREGTGCTPRGRHRVRAKIGGDQPAGAVFAGRRPTGEIYSESLAARYPDRDWILTRILWLGGLEPGFNRYGAVDTQRRYIYIHGTPRTEPMGVPLSHGCIRMHDADLIDLFDRVAVGCPVEIVESAGEPA